MEQNLNKRRVTRWVNSGFIYDGLDCRKKEQLGIADMSRSKACGQLTIMLRSMGFRNKWKYNNSIGRGWYEFDLGQLGIFYRRGN